MRNSELERKELKLGENDNTPIIDLEEELEVVG